jgi:AAA15 family ATPase/GTPase
VLSLLRGSDLGLSDMSVSDEEVPNNVRKIVERLFADDNERLEAFRRNPKRTRIELLHRGADPTALVPLPFEAESRGTRAFFALAGSIVDALATGGVLFVDELDASLHPLLAIDVVRLFNDAEINVHNAQLIFNTHDTNILESGVLRRDQIWFTEKDASGATYLYPLTDYRVRKGENTKRGYLLGRYGAIPYVQPRRSLIAAAGSTNG